MILHLGRQDPSVPRSKWLLSDKNSNILLYLTGHGGNEFFKFQDAEELTAVDLGNAILQMHLQDRYNEMLVVADTCQAATLGNYITAPNVVQVGSSDLGENSYSVCYRISSSSPSASCRLCNRCCCC